MRQKISYLFICILFVACTSTHPIVHSTHAPFSMVGTWKLLTGTVTENSQITVTDYTKGISFIKIINEKHFAFLQHDLYKGKDSAATFVSGGGKYSLKDSSYTEHLEYCSSREWEGNDFSFNVRFIRDTLIQSGIEKVEGTGINRINTEKYIRLH